MSHQIIREFTFFGSLLFVIANEMTFSLSDYYDCDWLIRTMESVLSACKKFLSVSLNQLSSIDSFVWEEWF